MPKVLTEQELREIRETYKEDTRNSWGSNFEYKAVKEDIPNLLATVEHQRRMIEVMAQSLANAQQCHLIDVQDVTKCVSDIAEAQEKEASSDGF